MMEQPPRPVGLDVTSARAAEPDPPLWPPRWQVLAPLALLALAPAARFVLLAAGRETVWLDHGVPALALLLALSLGRGDAARRWMMPLVLLLVGWPWLLVYTALGHVPSPWARLAVAAVEWVPRRVVAILRSPPAPWDHPLRRPERLVLVTLVLSALAADLAVCLRVPEPAVVGIDGAWYLSAAESIITRGVFEAQFPLASDGRPAPTRATRMPGYPLYLAGCRLVAGRHGIRLASGLQALAHAAAVLLVFAIGRVLSGPTAGLAAALLFVLYSPLHLGVARLLTEPLAVPLYLLSLCLLLRAYGTGRARFWVSAGVALGAATLLRPNSFLSPFCIALASAWFLRRSRRSPVGPAVMLGAFVLAMVPWWVRNAAVLHSFVPVTTLGGVHAWAGNDVRTGGRYRRHHYEAATRVLRACGGDEVAADRVMQRMARKAFVGNIRRRAAGIPGLYHAKLETLVLQPEARGRGAGALHLFLLGAGLIGSLSLRRSPLSWIAATLAAPIVLLHLATYGMEARYFLPLMPMVIVWASVAIVQVMGWGCGAPSPSPPATPPLARRSL